MFTALPTVRQENAPRAGTVALDAEHPDTIETRLWLEEHEWLYGLLRSEDNVSPTFRFPDLISACVSLVFLHDDAATRIFDFLGTQLVLRSPPLCRQFGGADTLVLRQARLNMADRAARCRLPRPV